MNDFRQIKFGGKLLQVEEFNWMHEICIGFIRKNIEESTANHIVVVTHHLPTLQVVAAHHRGSVLNNAFASDYDNLMPIVGLMHGYMDIRIPILTRK
jgi:hypothetical protein